MNINHMSVYKATQRLHVNCITAPITATKIADAFPSMDEFMIVLQMWREGCFSDYSLFTKGE